jgi:hypothetical protein
MSIVSFSASFGARPRVNLDMSDDDDEANDGRVFTGFARRRDAFGSSAASSGVASGGVSVRSRTQQNDTT